MRKKRNIWIYESVTDRFDITKGRTVTMRKATLKEVEPLFREVDEILKRGKNGTRYIRPKN